MKTYVKDLNGMVFPNRYITWRNSSIRSGIGITEEHDTENKTCTLNVIVSATQTSDTQSE